MGLSLGDAFVEIRPDVSKFGPELRAELQRSTKDAKSYGLDDVLGAAAFTAGVAVITKGAGELEQAVGGTEAVFGAAEAAVSQFAEGAAESAGLSEQAARQLTSQIGGLLKGFGFTRSEAAATSVQLAQLGADLAATFGGEPEQAVEALGAALRGEFDPLERFGVSLNAASVNLKAVELGLADSATEVDGNAKAQAALALIMERSADAQGQFARESETAAGAAAISAAKAKNAADDLGTNFLPVYAKISEVVGVAADAFGSLPGPVQTALVALVGVAALRGPFSRMTSTVVDLGKSVTNLGSGLSQAGLLAGAAGASFALWQYQMQRAEQDVQRLTSSITEAFDQPGITADKARAKLDELRRQIEDLRKEGERPWWQLQDADYTAEADRAREATEGLAQQLQRIVDEQAPALAQALGIAGDEALAFLFTQLNLGKAYADVNAAVAAYQQLQGGATTATGSAADAAGKQAEAVDDLRSALLAVVDGQEAVEDSQRRIGDATQRVTDAQQGYVAAQQRVADAERSRQDSLRGLEEAQQRVIEAQQALTSALSGADKERADIAVERARLRLQDAEERVGKGEFDSERDRQQALLDVRQARLDLYDAEERAASLVTDAQQKVADAERGVIDAQAGVQAASRGLTDAQRGVAAAARDITEAQRGVIDAQNGAARATLELRERQAKLRDTVAESGGAVGDLRGELAALVADAPGIAGGLQPIITALEVIDALRRAAGGAARPSGASDIYGGIEAALNDPSTPPEIRDRITGGTSATDGPAGNAAPTAQAEGARVTIVNNVNGPTAREFADDTMRELSFALTTLAG